MTKKQKKNLIRILASGVLYAAALLLPKAEAWEWAFFIPAYILISYDVLWGAVKTFWTDVCWMSASSCPWLPWVPGP